MTEAQTKIIEILKENNGQAMTIAQMNKKVSDVKLHSASATSLVKKGIISKVEGSSPVQYFIDENFDVSKQIIDFLSNETIQYSTLEKMNQRFGDVSEKVAQMVEEGILLHNTDFNIYSVKRDG